MMNRFDEMAKVLASPLSRRETMRQCGRIVAGGFLALIGAGPARAAGPAPRLAFQLSAQSAAQRLYACQVACRKVVGLVARNLCIQKCLVPATCPQGGTCDNFSPCLNSQLCVCTSTTEGTTFCALAIPCPQSNCTKSADCPAGSKCIVNTCCDGNVCVPPCNPV